MLGGCNDEVYVTEWFHTGGRDYASRETASVPFGF